jgi:hypothetical protein
MRAGTLDEARAVKRVLAGRLGDEPAVRGIGIARRGEGYVVKLDLATALPGDRVPAEIDGVTIVVEVVGEIRAR